MMVLLQTAIFLGVVVTVATSERYTDYNAGESNPNLENPMFWNDAANVLQDLTKFQALYIKFHSCVWTPYASGSSSYACTDGSAAGDDNFWYVGSVPCFRANAAFSLYGVLLPTEADLTTRQLKRKTGNMCTKASYINSFFTTYGATTISNALGLVDDAHATAACSYVQGSNNNENRNNQGGGGGGGKDQGGGEKYSNYMSYTTGCESGKFVYSEFHGKYCDGNRYNGTIDLLETYNANMEEISCNQIWDYDVSIGSKRGRRDLGYGSLAETILYTSKACSTTEYPGVCPDPFGLNAQYANGISTSAMAPYHSQAQIRLGFFSLIFSLTGVALIGLAAANLIRKRFGTRTVVTFTSDGTIYLKKHDYPEMIAKVNSSVSLKSPLGKDKDQQAAVKAPPDESANRYRRDVDSLIVAPTSILGSTATNKISKN